MPRLSAKAVVDKAAGGKPASRKGGARPGAGRKSKKEKNQTAISAAEKKIKDRLPEYIENLHALANGGYELIETIYEPAATVMIDTFSTDDKGKIVKGKHLAFPDLPPEQLVIVKRVVKIKDRDRAANEYLLDRIMGRPQQPVKFENLSDEELIREIEKALGGSGS
jgi:hypothetical protein